MRGTCLPAVLIDRLHAQWNGPTKLDEQVAGGIERRMRERVTEDRAGRRPANVAVAGYVSGEEDDQITFSGAVIESMIDSTLNGLILGAPL
jgi:hypothetical protein